MQERNNFVNSTMMNEALKQIANKLGILNISYGKYIFNLPIMQ